jgi:hypothetical protein
MAIPLKFAPVDKEMEDKLVKFSCSLKSDMSPEDVIGLYDTLEKDHWLIESKLILLRTLFQATLSKQFEKEAEDTVPPMFR